MLGGTGHRCGRLCGGRLGKAIGVGDGGEEGGVVKTGRATVTDDGVG